MRRNERINEKNREKRHFDEETKLS